MDPKGQFLHSLLSHSGRAYATEVATLMGERDLMHGMNFLDIVSDTSNRLASLGAALIVGRRAAFALEMEWAQRLYTARGVAGSYLSDSLTLTAEVLDAQLPAADKQPALDCIAAALAHLQEMPQLGQPQLGQPELGQAELGDSNAAEADAASRPGAQLPDPKARALLEALLTGRRATALALAEEIAAGPGGRLALLTQVLPAVQVEVGALWQSGRIDVAEEHLGSRIIEEILARSATVAAESAAPAIRVLAASVSGNDHDIGLRIVTELLRDAGMEVHLLGANTPSATIYRSCEEFDIQVLALSVTMLIHLPQTAELIQRFPSGQQRPAVLLGGPLFAALPDLHQELGADASVGDAAEVAAAVRALLR